LLDTQIDLGRNHGKISDTQQNIPKKYWINPLKWSKRKLKRNPSIFPWNWIHEFLLVNPPGRPWREILVLISTKHQQKPRCVPLSFQKSSRQKPQGFMYHLWTSFPSQWNIHENTPPTALHQVAFFYSIYFLFGWPCWPKSKKQPIKYPSNTLW
jgi:hypothetical protein